MDTCIACGYALVDKHEACPECGLSAAQQAACGDVQFESPAIQRRIIRAHSAFVLATILGMISLLLLTFVTQGIGDDFGWVEIVARLAMFGFSVYAVWQLTRATVFGVRRFRLRRKLLQTIVVTSALLNIASHLTANVLVVVLEFEKLEFAYFAWIWMCFFVLRWSVLLCIATAWIGLRLLPVGARKPRRGNRLRATIGSCALVLAAVLDALALSWWLELGFYIDVNPAHLSAISTVCMVVALPIFAWRTNPLPNLNRVTRANRQSR